MNKDLPLEEIPKTGFKILKVHVQSYNYTQYVSASHYLFIKGHESRGNNNTPTNTPPERTLFISNIPADATREHIKNIFEYCGEIEDVLFHEIFDEKEFLINEDNDLEGDDPELVPSEDKKQQGKKSKKRKSQNSKSEIIKDTIFLNSLMGIRTLMVPGSSAYLIFKDPEGLKNALSMKQKERHWSYDYLTDEPLEWTNKYSYLRKNPNELQLKIDKYMRNFEEAEQERRRSLEAKHNQPDEDGFILVTRTGKRNVNTD
ncbi:7761_t:CDS:2, partial [Acaulospora colombiana]